MSGADATLWGEPVGGLRLGLAASGATVQLALENVGGGTLEVRSHVLGSVHLDWYRVVLRGADGRERELGFIDDRDESTLIVKTLAPGNEVRHTVDLAAWALRDVNGNEPLAHGWYDVRASYDAEPREGSWSGRLEAGPVETDVP